MKSFAQFSLSRDWYREKLTSLTTRELDAVTVRTRLDELDEIFSRRNLELYTAALAITRDPDSAEDCVHDSLIAVAELSHEINEIEPYLFRVVRNKAIHCVKQLAKIDTSSSIKDYLTTKSDSFEMARLIDQIKRHIGCLDINHQQVLIMKLFSDLTFDEIANIMESSPNTVASWYRRGLQQLQERINED